MKKLILLLAISTIAISAIFAKSAQVQLTTTIEESEGIEYQLYYEKSASEDVAINDNSNPILVGSLESNGTTNDFKILASYNKEKGSTLTVTITPGPFNRMVNNVAISSGITPSVVYDSDNKTTLDNGRHVNKKIFGFHFSWVGNENIDAGDYTSDITIDYKIE